MSTNLPASRHWWNEPPKKVELTWTILAFITGLTLFFGLILWSGYGQHKLAEKALHTISIELPEKRQSADEGSADHAEINIDIVAIISERELV